MANLINPTTDAPTTYKPKDAVAYHGGLAPDWENRYQKKSFRARVEALEECFRGRSLEGTSWVDAGCGTGTLSRVLVEHGCKVAGFDAAPGMIQVAREEAMAHPKQENFRFEVCTTIEELPEVAESVDGVLCSSVIEYVDDVESSLLEFRRILKPGGVLLVSVPNSESVVRRAQVFTYRWGQRIGRQWLSFVEYSRNEYSAAGFQELLDESGFAVEKILVFGSPLPRWMQRWRYGGSLLMFRAVRR